MSSKQTAKRRIDYPMGSISSGTMRAEDLIPCFAAELEWLSGKTRNSPVPRKTRTAHNRLARLILDCVAGECNHNHIEDVPDSPDNYFMSESADSDLEALSDALGEYCAPYFYFGSHPGDGADYGFWLSESWDEDFDGIKVSDSSEIPTRYRGEVAVVNDHGNVSLYVKTSRGMREIWSVV